MKKRETLRLRNSKVSVVKSAGGDPEQVQLLQEALELVRAGNTSGVAVAVCRPSGIWTDFCGRQDDLACATALLHQRNMNQWVKD